MLLCVCKSRRARPHGYAPREEGSATYRVVLLSILLVAQELWVHLWVEHTSGRSTSHASTTPQSPSLAKAFPATLMRAPMLCPPFLPTLDQSKEPYEARRGKAKASITVPHWPTSRSTLSTCPFPSAPDRAPEPTCYRSTTALHRREVARPRLAGRVPLPERTHPGTPLKVRATPHTRHDPGNPQSSKSSRACTPGAPRLRPL